MTRDKRLAEIEESARRMGRTIGGSLPPGVGFCLMLYHFGEGGFSSWISNGERQSMLAGILELVEKVYADPKTDEATRASVRDWIAGFNPNS